MPSSALTPVAAALALLDAHRERTTTVKATQARHDFFPLLDSVVADPAEIVEVEHKGLGGRALLVNAQFRDYVRQLEDTVRALVGPVPDSEPFHLAGSLGSVNGSPAIEESLQTLRTRERRGAATRFADL